MGSTVSNWTTVTTLSEGNTCIHSFNLHSQLVIGNTSNVSLPPIFSPPAPQYVAPFSVGSNLTAIWLDWAGSFSLNGYLKEYSVTESQLRVYTGFYSFHHIPRTSQKSESTYTSSTKVQLKQGGNMERINKYSTCNQKKTPLDKITLINNKIYTHIDRLTHFRL